MQRLPARPMPPTQLLTVEQRAHMAQVAEIQGQGREARERAEAEWRAREIDMPARR